MGRVVVGIDPGETIGLAWVTYQHGEQIDRWHLVDAQATDVSVALTFLQMAVDQLRPDYDMTVVIEDYQSSGPLTKEAKLTIEQVGFFHGWFTARSNQPRNILCKIVPPGRRQSRLEQARKLSPNGAVHAARHGVDALAHVLKEIAKEEETNGSE